MKNQVYINNNTVKIFFSGKYADKFPFALIDLCDLSLISPYTWHTDSRGYVYGGRKRIHQYILGDRPPLVIDHINRKRWDNRRANLRHTTESQNVANQDSRGICYDKSRKKWMAHIRVNYVKKNLGRFNSAEEALKARKKAVDLYF